MGSQAVARTPQRSNPSGVFVCALFSFRLFFVVAALHAAFIIGACNAPATDAGCSRRLAGGICPRLQGRMAKRP